MAMILLTELYDISRFKNFDTLCSYIGLIPDTDSSGDTDLKKGIKSRRNAQLRGILIECCWVAVRKNLALLMSFNELSKKMPKNNAIIRVGGGEKEPIPVEPKASPWEPVFSC
jgi:transposase